MVEEQEKSIDLDEKAKQEKINALFGDSDDSSDDDNDNDNNKNQPKSLKRKLQQGGKSNTVTVAKTLQERLHERKALEEKEAEKNKDLEEDDDDIKPQDDNEFVASDDDRKSLADEYAKEKQGYNSDPDPHGDDKNMKTEEEDLNNLSHIQFADKMSKQRKREKITLTDLQVKDMINECFTLMDHAVETDRKYIDKGLPAIQKIKSCGQVMKILNNPMIWEDLLDHRLLEKFYDWIVPYRKVICDESVRTSIYQLLPKLPIEISQLKSSKLGRLVAYLKQHPKESPANVKILNDLLEKWNKKLVTEIELETGVTERKKKQEELEQLEHAKKTSLLRRKKKKNKNKNKIELRNDNDDDEDEDEATAKRKRASIPQPISYGFKKEVRRNFSNSKRSKRQRHNRDEKNDTILRLEKKMRDMKKNKNKDKKAVNASIEGKF